MKYIINRSFIVNKEKEGASINGNSLDIKVKKKNGELDLVPNPQRYLDNQLFPFEIRAYSMFKGKAD